MKKLIVLPLVVASIVTLNACSTTATPTVQQGARAEVTFDGLHRVNDTLSDNVWVKPDIDLSQYDGLMLETGGIQYRTVKSYRRNSTEDEFPLSQAQKDKLEAAVAEVLMEEIQQVQNFTITDKPGRGVLKITVGLMDVVSRIPPVQAGRSDFYIRDLGQASLILDIRDSRTNEALARVVDSRNVEPIMVMSSNPATNLNEVKRSVRVWGERIRNGLDELHEIGCYVCNIPGSVSN